MPLLPFPALAPLRLLCVLTPLVVVSACKFNPERAEPKEPYFQTEPQIVPEVHRNQLKNAATDFLRNRASDALPWQPWTAELFEHSRLEQKLVFALVVGGKYPSAITLLDRLDADEDLVRILSENYLCTLIDVQAHPELAVYSVLLARELPRRAQIPTMIWFSHEKNPIAWLPLTTGGVESIDEVIGSSHEMLSRIWRDDSKYVVANSQTNNDDRIVKITNNLAKTASWELNYRGRRQRAGQTLSALYDPTSRSIDRSGRMVPFFLLQFAASLASDPATPENLRERLATMVQGHTDLLLESAVHDPLDGGFFHSRQARGWALPTFVKNSATQLEAVLALAASGRLLNQERYLEAARSALNFTEARFMAEDERGLRSFEYPPPSSEAAAHAYLWSWDELHELLSPEEFQVVERRYGIKALGNIPLETDPKRTLLHLNSLGPAKSPAEIASELGIPVERARGLLDSAGQRLVERRRTLLPAGQAGVESTVTTELMARFVAALTELGAACDDEALLARARQILQNLRLGHYSDETGLMRIRPSGQQLGIPARGLDYAVVLDALFRLYRQDLDPAHLIWADQLMREALDRLAGDDGLIREAPMDDQVLTAPLHSRSMIFGLSTWGVLHGPLKRLHQLSGSDAILTTFRAHAARLAPRLLRQPILHTDFASACWVAQSDTLVCLDGPREDDRLQALHGVLKEPGYSGVTVAHLDSSLPASFDLPEPGEGVRAVVRRSGLPAGVATTPAELRALLDAPTSVE